MNLIKLDPETKNVKLIKMHDHRLESNELRYERDQKFEVPNNGRSFKL